MTKSKLRGRLGSFNSSITGKTGHSGGNTICEELGNYGKWKKNKKLFVAVMPIECNTKRRNSSDLKQMGVVAALEYMAFAEFQDKTECDRPKYNIH